jgi:hypothetical protein
MKLQELAAPKPSKQIAKVFESYFGSSISFDRLTRNQTRAMLSKVRGVLGEHRSTTARHTSEQNPKYLQLVMMEQALSSRLREEDVVEPSSGGGATNPGTSSGSAPGQSTKPAAQAAPQPTTGANPPAQTPANAMKDPNAVATSMAMQKMATGAKTTPAEQKLAAMAMAESRLRREYRILKESEIQQAQVVLAAQDLVDKMQDMVEEVSELQFKDLPALVESIKNQVGVDQAMQFNTDATSALAGLLQNLQGAKQQLEAALGVVTGTGGPDMSAIANAGAAANDLGAAGADMGAAGADMGLAGPPPGEEEEPPAAPAGAALGRARR